MPLKANLHFHTKADDIVVPYDIYKGIDYAKEKGFDVLAYTSHKKFLFKKEYAEYAEKKGMLLIPGMEIEIKKKHIVLLNCDKEAEGIKNFNDLKNYRNKNPQILVMAPHPYVFSPKSLRGKLLENIGLFDAIEMSVFSNKLFNFNKKAEEVAQKHNKPFIATSDTHFLCDLERGYALIDAEVPPQERDARISNQIEDLEKFGKKTTKGILKAVREGKFQNKMDSMSPLAMMEIKIKSGFNYFSASVDNGCRPFIALLPSSKSGNPDR